MSNLSAQALSIVIQVVDREIGKMQENQSETSDHAFLNEVSALVDAADELEEAYGAATEGLQNHTPYEQLIIYNLDD